MSSAAVQRLFVAVIPSDDALEHLDVVAEPMRIARPDLRWVAPQRLHVTLAFMPQVDERVADELPDVLAEAVAGTPPLRLSLAGAGRFDERVLWTGLDGDTERLSSLADRVVRTMAAAGASPQRQTFRPHLTIARRSGHLDAQLGGLAAQLVEYAGPLWQADEVHLIRSILGRSVRHETVATAALTAAT